MLEDLVNLAVPRNVRGDNPTSAENQQERLITKRGQNPQRPCAEHPVFRDEDMVPTAWRHAGMVIKEKPSARLDQIDQAGKTIKRNSLSGKFRPARMA
jgi:hypothetical protein